jgi:uroporphyrinogen-III synthase
MPEKVVITRPLGQANGLVQAVAALGREPVLLPLLEIQPLDDDTRLKHTLAGLDRYALAAFVSPNAIDAAFAHIDAWPSGVAVGVVGEGSRAALARHGVTAANATIFCPANGDTSDTEGLLRALDLPSLAGRRVLIVRGESGRELMAESFAAAGALVDTVAAYRRALPVLDNALASTLHALLATRNDWLITSSEALRGLVGLARQLGGDAGVARLQQQYLVVPHARIAESARAMGFAHVTLTGSGDERMLAALQSQE